MLEGLRIGRFLNNLGVTERKKRYVSREIRYFFGWVNYNSPNI